MPKIKFLNNGELECGDDSDDDDFSNTEEDDN